ncbi:MAG: type II secretion system GspH family protein [Candidatus Hydrogenedentes bacterium]|nr:type II secretion system GspH family protein [Candidatus Hydrogenedentota bacterium]
MAATTWRDESGVTLLELTVASGILAVALVLLMGGLVSIADTNEITENQSMASSHLESVIEEIQALPYDQLLEYQPPALPGLGATSTVQVAGIDSGGNQVLFPVDPATLGTPLPNPTEVQVTITWNDVRGRPYTARASTLCRR